MQTATSSVEFSFNDSMYRQTDDVAMGSPLGPALANIFVVYQETKLFLNVKKPLISYRCVDDAFAVFENKDDCEKFLSLLNSLHSSLRFTFEKKLNSFLPFLANLTLSQFVQFCIFVLYRFAVYLLVIRFTLLIQKIRQEQTIPY